MRLRFALVMLLTSLTASAYAQDMDPAAVDTQQQWAGLNIAIGNMQRALATYMAKMMQTEQAAAQTEGRLKWMLENPEAAKWIPKAPPK
jgi:hypothetical protein